MAKKRFLIADDHPSIRKGVRKILSDEFMDAEFGEAQNGAEVFKMIHNEKWDVLILDVDMPGRNGLDVLAQLQTEKKIIPTLMFSLHPEEQMAVRAVKLGAYGYLNKNSLDEELLKAVNQLLMGKRYFSQTVSELLLSEVSNPDNKPPHAFLSERQLQVFIMIANGKRISEIAKELSLSVPTISTFRHRILEKMGMKSSAELTSYAIRNNMV